MEKKKKKREEKAVLHTRESKRDDGHQCRKATNDRGNELVVSKSQSYICITCNNALESTLPEVIY